MGNPFVRSFAMTCPMLRGEHRRPLVSSGLSVKDVADAKPPNIDVYKDGSPTDKSTGTIV